jgi:hypothetical protein
MSHYGNSKRELCNLALTVGGRTYVLEAVGNHDCGQPTRLGPSPGDGRSRHEIAVREILGDAGELELVIVAAAVDQPDSVASEEMGDSLVEQLVLCAANKAGAPRCARAALGGLDFTPFSADDGYDQWHEQRWKRGYSIQAGMLELQPPKGKPESYELDVPSGRHRLRIAP